MKAPSSMTVWCLCLAVVVAGDRAGPDVDVGADRRVAEVGQVIRLRPGAQRRLLQLDEVADLAPLANHGFRPQMSERPDRRPICNPRTNDEAEVVDR